MVSNEIMKNFPKCELMRVLAEKVGQRDDLGFSPLSVLEMFRKDVTDEMSQINVLFPEYTPHNEGYHLKNLFYIADTVLGTNLIEAMNAGELFTLAVALYGHDWGMAVNEKEKNYIIRTINSSDKVPDGLCLLHDEKNRFSKFVQDQQLLDKDGELKDIPIEKWREYVRDTHAFRSGERIREFFEPIDGGVAEAAARVCAGHWLSFEELQDHDYYPLNYSVMRDQVNLRAISVYLRLIDLLDLAEDRTPYVIWKFVAPKDSKSKMEWDKHRALRSVICTSYQVGRVIRVDGSTDSHEVYAALEDLRLWCEAQFRGCNDILARMNDPRHKLDIYNIDWNVEAKGFKKTSIGFQFDRERMFEILGNEIYQGDPYVFLRELLQNSIDAIRMRREVLRKNAKIEPANFGEIRVKVEHLDDNDAIITWSDDGIGMDEYIIQNYLAVAGKSYYRSPDFDKIGIEMDPISRFGIGILSCFIVADSIEIETCLDPNLHQNSGALKITIPDQSKRFRVEVFPEGSANIGTTIKVFVSGKKISKDKDSEFESLDVTGYLSIIAGFVEFPIIIEEDDNKTIILHPKKDFEIIKSQFGNDYKLHKLDLEFPWSEAIVPQDLSISKELLREKRFNLNSDFGLEDHEGILSYLVPSQKIDFLQSGPIVAKNADFKYKDKKIRCSAGWSIYSSSNITENFGKSSWFDESCSVYRDGILIPNVSRPRDLDKSIDGLPKSRLVVNLSKKIAPIADLARSNLNDPHDHWYDSIHKRHAGKILEMDSERLLSLDPLERLLEMGRIVAFDRIDPLDLWKKFPHDHWPVVFIRPQGRILVEEYRDILKKPLFKYPKPIEERESIILFNSDIYKGILKNWRGADILISPLGYHSIQSMGSLGALQISNTPVDQSYHEVYAQFVQPPWEGCPPLIQYVLEKNQEEFSTRPISEEDLFKKGFENPKSLEANELFMLNKLIFGFHERHWNVKFINFAKPFDNLFAYGSKIINIGHPSGQDLLRFICCIKSEKNSINLPKDTLGELEDLITMFIGNSIDDYSEFISSQYMFELKNDTDLKLTDIWRAAKKARIPSTVDGEVAIPEIDDFIPGTIFLSEDDRRKFFNFSRDEAKNFGYPLL